jgi:putative ABC transport system permease protein
VGSAVDNTTLYYQTFIDANFINVMKIPLIYGRNFSDNLNSDASSVIISTFASSMLGFNSPREAVGQSIIWGGTNHEIIGVIKDIHYASFKDAVYPLLLINDPNYYYTRYFAFKLNEDNTHKEEIETLKAQYDQYFPDDVFISFILNDAYIHQYNNELVLQKVSYIFAIFAILVACLGLFGMSLLEAISNIKYAGIRKVVGATGLSIVRTFLWRYVTLIFISQVISIPVIIVVANRCLQNFPERIEVKLIFFLLPMVVMPIIALLTISINMLRIAKTDPVKSLKYE